MQSSNTIPNIREEVMEDGVVDPPVQEMVVTESGRLKHAKSPYTFNSGMLERKTAK